VEYRKLGKTNLDVSVICLGTMTWGEQNTFEEGYEQMDYAVDQGVNFFDTAELYPIPPKPDTQGKTEECIGNWFKKTGQREKIILASKVAGRAPMNWLRGEWTLLDRENIESAIDASLSRLQTDYIDVYQLHWPDRRMSMFGADGLGYKHYEAETIPILETLKVLSDLVKAGKIRYVGVSNETPWGVHEYIRLSETKSLPKIQTIQNPYSLLNRTYEIGLAEMSYRENIGLLAYSPLGFGVLTGKYLNDMPSKSRLGLFGEWFTRYSNQKCRNATSKYFAVAKKYNMSLCQMALAFVNTRPFVTSNIIGATTMAQLKENIKSIDTELTDEMMGKINLIHINNPNPAP